MENVKVNIYVKNNKKYPTKIYYLLYIVCSPNCKTCSEYEVCTSCPDGSYRTGPTCDECELGYFFEIFGGNP